MDIREDIKLEGIKEGVKRGRQEGKQEGKQEIILNMLKNKIDISVISKMTGLSKDEIDKLKRIDS